MQFPYIFIRSWTLPYDPYANVSINAQQVLKHAHWMFLNYSLDPKFCEKKMNRKQRWNMQILEYSLNFSPQVIYYLILKRLNKALYWKDTCGSSCDSSKQWDWGCVSNHGMKPCTLPSKEELSAPRETLIEAS